MKDGIHIKNSIVIPGHEIEVTASRSGGKVTISIQPNPDAPKSHFSS